MYQVGDALEVNWKVTTLQETARERPRSGEMPLTDETRRNGEQVDIRERHRVVRETVRIVLHVRQVDRHTLLRLLNSSLSRQTSTAALRHEESKRDRETKGATSPCLTHVNQ